MTSIDSSLTQNNILQTPVSNIFDDLLNKSKETMRMYRALCKSDDSVRCVYFVYTADIDGVLFYSNPRIFHNATYFGTIDRVVEVKQGARLPPDLKRAIDKNQISLEHVPKTYTRKSIITTIRKQSFLTHMQCVTEIISTSPFKLSDQFTYDLTHICEDHKHE